MKGGNKKCAGKNVDAVAEADQAPYPEIENCESDFAGDDVAAEEQGEEGEGDGGEREEEGGEDRPKLPKGFYEIEAIRDKRVRKVSLSRPFKFVYLFSALMFSFYMHEAFK